METRQEKFLRLREKGLTMDAIARMERVSRQRVWQILNYAHKDKEDSYQKLRTFVLTRDLYQCQWGKQCEGRFNSLNLSDRKKIMIVHHIDGNHTNNTPKNMITLCRNCHTRFHLGTNRDPQWRGRPKTRVILDKECPVCHKQFHTYREQAQFCTRKCFLSTRKLDSYRGVQQNSKEYNKIRNDRAREKRNRLHT